MTLLARKNTWSRMQDLTIQSLNEEFNNIVNQWNNHDQALSKWQKISTSGTLNVDGNSTFAGTLAIGDLVGNFTTRNSYLLVAATRPTGAQNGHGISEASNFTGDATTAYASIESICQTFGSNNYDHLASFQAEAGHASSGTLTTLYDIVCHSGNAGGTITDRKCVYVQDAGGAGTITNQYAVYIEAMTRGATLNYGIYKLGTAPNLLTGPTAVGATATNDDAAAGFFGEYTESNITSYANAATSNQYGNITSVSLTSGNWLVSGIVNTNLNGATMTRSRMALSINSGNTTTDQVSGVNDIDMNVPTAASNVGGDIPIYRLKLTGTTTVYLKAAATYSAGTPQYLGSIKAYRPR